MQPGINREQWEQLRQAVIALSEGWPVLLCTIHPRLEATVDLLLEPNVVVHLSASEASNLQLESGRQALQMCDDEPSDGGAETLIHHLRRTYPSHQLKILVALESTVSHARLQRLWHAGADGLCCREQCGQGQLLQALAVLLRGNSWLDPLFAEVLRSPREGALINERDAQLVQLVARGRSTREMAALLEVRSDSIRRRLSALYAKTGCRNQRGLLAWALEQGLLQQADLRLALEGNAPLNLAAPH